MSVVDQVQPLITNLQELVTPAQAAYIIAHNNQVTFFNNNLSIGHIPSGPLVAQLQADQAASASANSLVLDLIAYTLNLNNWALNQDQRNNLGLVPFPFPQPGPDVAAYAASQNVSLALPAPVGPTPPAPPTGSLSVQFGVYLALMGPANVSASSGNTLRDVLNGDTVPVGSIVPAPDGHSYQRCSEKLPFGVEQYYIQVS